LTFHTNFAIKICLGKALSGVKAGDLPLESAVEHETGLFRRSRQDTANALLFEEEVASAFPKFILIKLTP